MPGRSARGAIALLLLAAALLAALPAGGGAAPKKQQAKQRIVALTPFSANTLARLGVVPVAVGQTLGGKERFSPKLKRVEVLPLSHPNGPNLEQIASLDPDVVFSSRTWAKGNQAMRRLGIRVIVREPLSVRSAYANTYKIGRVVGRTRLARKQLKQMRRQVNRARRGIEERPRVMLILGVGRTPFTMLPNSWGGDVVAKAGGELITGGVSSRSGFVRISDELVIAEDPDVIIAVPHANEDDIPSLGEYLKDNPAWGSTTAAREDRVHVSVDNSLLQAGTDVARLIRKVRRSYLKN